MTLFLSHFGREVMTSNRLSIHIPNGDIYYDNHNTGIIFILLLLISKIKILFTYQKSSYKEIHLKNI